MVDIQHLMLSNVCPSFSSITIIIYRLSSLFGSILFHDLCGCASLGGRRGTLSRLRYATNVLSAALLAPILEAFHEILEGAISVRSARRQLHRLLVDRRQNLVLDLLVRLGTSVQYKGHVARVGHLQARPPVASLWDLEGLLESTYGLVSVALVVFEQTKCGI